MMQGKVAIVTGSTNGIGEVTALELARMSATVILMSRNQTKLQNTASKIRSETGNQQVSTIQVDLSSMADIRRAVQSFHADFDRLDVLVNNAGAYFPERKESDDGYEMTFALNHLNYFLLTHLLLDTIKQTAQSTDEARIVNVSSDAHQTARLNFDDLQMTQRYEGFSAYGRSKLMNVMFTYALARRLKGTGVTTNALHPGLVRTGFGADANNVAMFFVGILQKLFGKTPQEGAQTNIYLATSPQVYGVTGKYWANKQQKRSNAASYDETAQQRLWEVSEQLTGIAKKVTA